MMCLASNVSYDEISLQKPNTSIFTLLIIPGAGDNDGKQCHVRHAGKSLRHPISHIPAPELAIHNSDLFPV